MIACSYIDGSEGREFTSKGEGGEITFLTFELKVSVSKSLAKVRALHSSLPSPSFYFYGFWLGLWWFVFKDESTPAVFVLEFINSSNYLCVSTPAPGNNFCFEKQLL